MQGTNRRGLLRGAGGLLGVPMVGAWAQGSGGARPPRIKVGQIGVGHAHASKLAVYRQSEDYEVVGVVEPDDRLRKQAEARPEYQGLPWMSREQLLNVPGLQAVLVETDVSDLLNQAEVCVLAGMYVHLDKPAGESLAQYRRILEAAERQGRWVQMGYMYRYNPGVILLRSLLQKGWLGEVFEVQAVMSKVVPPADRAQFARFPGGIMFELGCHVVDLVVGVLGAPSKVSPFPRRSSKPNDGLLDNALAVFEYPNATATVRSSALEVEGFARRQLTVCGAQGTFHVQPLDAPAVRIAFESPRGDFRKGYQDVPMPKYIRYVDDAVDMARVIRGEKGIDFKPAHDLAVQRAVLLAGGSPIDE